MVAMVIGIFCLQVSSYLDCSVSGVSWGRLQMHLCFSVCVNHERYHTPNLSEIGVFFCFFVVVVFLLFFFDLGTNFTNTFVC